MFVSENSSTTVASQSITNPKLDELLDLINTSDNNKSEYQYQLGLAYETGEKELKKNLVLAGKWYMKASKNDHPEAQYKLAIAYKNGTHGFQQEPENFKKWLESAAKKGHAEAQYELASAYKDGSHGFKKNPELSFSFYQKAAKNGHLEATAKLPSEHYAFAEMCQHGTYGVKKDIKNSIYHYKIASVNGIPEASYNLGFIYKDRENLPLEEEGQAIQRALYYFKQAMYQGNKDASFQIEQIYKEHPAQRPEPSKPVAKPSYLPAGFNRQERPKPQTVTSALIPGFERYRTSNDRQDELYGSETYFDLSTESQKENRQANPPSVRRKHPPIPLFANTPSSIDEAPIYKALFQATSEFSTLEDDEQSVVVQPSTETAFAMALDNYEDFAFSEPSVKLIAVKPF